ncbi:DUF1801 domain-containing protein [Brachybacterium hainanense]|uniref:DUF1801 domain-containing protein n=1 Tax=Brachybacterium hainanense TaxID=1541174 RepID=A0ABV6RAS6_9MICO
MAYEVTTHPTDVDPAQFCAELPTARRRDEGARLLALFGEVTGTEAIMWGPSMIGYGSFAYATEAGARGTWFVVGFSPRKASISLYGLQSPPGASDLLARLGKHRLGVGCVYVNGLRDIDEQVLRELVALAWSTDPTGC